MTMTMTLFSPWLQRRRARLRATIRGYALLKRRGNLGLVRRIRNDLADCRLEIEPGDVAARIFGAASTHAEPAVRQYLLERLLGSAFNRELLYGLGQGLSLSYPLPRKWRSALVAHGVRVSQPVSAMRWLGYLGKHFTRGLYVFVDTIAQTIIQRRRSASSPPAVNTLISRTSAPAIYHRPGGQMSATMSVAGMRVGRVDHQRCKEFAMMRSPMRQMLRGLPYVLFPRLIICCTRLLK